MKLKKILAGTLAATLVMTGVPNAGFTVFAETDVLSDTGASDEGISALAAEMQCLHRMDIKICH